MNDRDRLRQKSLQLSSFKQHKVKVEMKKPDVIAVRVLFLNANRYELYATIVMNQKV